MLRKKLFLFLSFTCLLCSSFAQKYNGYVLYSSMGGSAAYLMDSTQTNIKSWTSLPSSTGYSSYLEPGGILTRSAKATGVSFSGGPICGKVQKHDYAGNLIWDYTYSTTGYVTHHDICPMPNGNVLVIAYERKTAAEVTAAGGTNAIEMWPDKIVEIEPTGATTGNIVWEWKSWDHLMQNVDATKPNYVTSLVDHPEALNINYKQAKDWQHMNGVDYNPILDQIAWSSHNHNEWYIIDHSTTTAEAAGHTGGNSGKGGEILYRWGNPTAYGASGTAILNVTHDSHWIPEGSPNAGRLVGFNNKGVSSSQSSIDQVNLPINGYLYNRTAGMAYGPTTYDNRHAVNGYSSNMGSSEQLSNGNMLVCVATSGKIYEINAAGTQLWTKTTSGSQPQAHMYDSCYIYNPAPSIPTIIDLGSSLQSSTSGTYQWYMNGVLIAGANSQSYTPTVSGIYVVRTNNGCMNRYSKGLKYEKAAVGIKETDLSYAIDVYPNPASNTLHIKDNQYLGATFLVSIYDSYGRLMYNASSNKDIDVSNLASGLYTINIYSSNGKAVKKIAIQH
jgi:hypothetical protein